MTDPLFWLAALTLVGVLIALVDFVVGLNSITTLQTWAENRSAEPEAWPSVSIVVAARNEEQDIGGALRAMVCQTYPDLEIIVVNDRSDDRTAEIIERLAATDPRLQSITIKELPEGWLGKNHALQRGAKRARGELLLFMDADVVARPDAVRYAVAYLLQQHVDHVPLGADVSMPSVFLRAFLGAFAMAFYMFFKPWKAKNQNSRYFVGIGAFNLVRKEAFWRVGGMERIAMRPDDDVMFGKLIKSSGLRQEFVIGTGLVTVEWYRSLREMIDGLMKNTFASYNYSVLLMLIATSFQFAICVWPAVALLVTSGLTFWTNLAIVLVFIAQFAYASQRSDYVTAWHGVFFPVAQSLLIYIQWRAAFLTLFNGGISWRGTHYPLSELRANRL